MSRKEMIEAAAHELYEALELLWRFARDIPAVNNRLMKEGTNEANLACRVRHALSKARGEPDE